MAKRLRDVDDDGEPPLIAPVGERWAVIVGISRYHDPSLDLRYARRDAEALRDLLQTPEGGNFHPDRVRLLVDETATTAAITRGLRSFLLEAMPGDLVLLYFACHGGPDRRRPSGPLYLYSHDTDPADVAGTAVPMDDLDRGLREVRAERVVITVDTCHSGGAAAGLRATGRAEATNRYLDALAGTRGGVALLSSAEASESAEEDARWGGGHGVFTHFLLEGMRGAADGYQGERDGIVSVGELFEYVRHHVSTATDGRQHPAIGSTAFDRALPMAVTAELDVERHLTLARGLDDAGWRIGEAAPFLLAARQYAVAADLKRHLPSADAARGAALLAAGRAGEAVRVLRTVTTLHPGEIRAVTWLFLGVAEEETGDVRAAARAFREHVRRDPGGDETAWASAYADWLDDHDRPRRRRALLFGVGDFVRLSSLPGVANDLALMREALAGAEVTVLADATAGHDDVLRTLAAIGAEAGPDDVVVVYFSGHSDDRAGPDDPFLITGEDSGRPAGLTPRELVAALDLPAREVLLVLDTHVTAALMREVAATGPAHLRILLACGIGEVAYEVQFDDRMYGVFTYHLAAALAEGGAATYGELLDSVVDRMAVSPRSRQRPRLIGARSARLFSGRFPAADRWRAVRDRSALNGDGLARYDATDTPAVLWAHGRACLATGDHDAGWELLTRARELFGSPPEELSLDLALAALERGDRPAAEQILPRLPAARHPAGSGPAAVVIGADPEDGPASWAGAAERIAAALTGPAGVAAADLTVLTGPTVTRGRILAEATGQARRSADRLTLLVVTCAASMGSEPGGMPVDLSEPVVLHARDGHLPLRELLDEVRYAPNLVTMVTVATGRARLPRDLAPPNVIDFGWPVAGAVILIVTPTADGAAVAAAELLGQLPADARAGRSYQDWVGADSPPLISRSGRAGAHPPWHYTHGHQLRRTVLTDLAPELAIRRHIAETRVAAAAAAARQARADIDRHAATFRRHPEGHLQLGLALDACGRTAEALVALRTARNLYEDETVWRDEHRRDPIAAVECRRQARFHYGRLLLTDSGRLDEAVAALRDALAADEDDPRTLLTLSRAIWTLVERRSLVEATGYLHRYLNRGAPFGLETALADALMSQGRHQR